MTQSNASEGSLWCYVDPRDFSAPSAPPELANHRGKRRFWRRKPRQTDTDSSRRELPCGLVEALLQRLARRPELGMAVAALEAALAGHLDRQPSDTKPLMVLGAPHSANAEILTQWGRGRGWRVIESPGVEQILNRDTAWLEQFDSQSSPWVLPRLERCFLRHPSGLLLVQQLLEKLSHGLTGHCVVGCDSWAWAYLAHVPPGTAGIGGCLVAQAFDRHRLARWLQPDSPEGAEPICVLEAGSDHPILDQADAEEASDADAEGSGFLKHLAAYSLGIPEVAQTIWLSELRRVGPTRSEDTQLRHEFRLPAWRQLELPVPPKDVRDHAIVLHALLLHNGLAADLLPRLLPLSDSEIKLSLHRLCDARLVERVEQSWRISASGYPAVRKLLDDEGYLTDDLA